ncbi:MAG: phosphoribosylglycinamide formyltransferase [bacterium]|nr:phosphoribosylglycinamide formyltransferase [bacterium]
MTSSSGKLRVAVLLSGSGTSLENLLTHIEAGLPAEVVVVISSKNDAYGLERARMKGIPAVAVPRKQEPNITAFNDAIHAELAKYEIDLVALLGFLSLFELRGKFEGKCLNVHPALIPAFAGQGFYGERVHNAVLEAGVKVSGATVHFVDEQYDKGPILLQEAVPVLQGDTPGRLAARVVAAERRLVPEAIRLIAQGRVEIVQGRTRVSR